MCWGEGWHQMGGAWGWAWGLMMLLWLAGLIAVVIVILRLSTRSTSDDLREADAHQSLASLHEVIDMRYARGEIDEQQREAMLRTLKKRSSE